MKRDDEKETMTLEALREAFRKGLDSGAGKPADEILTRLERRCAAITLMEMP